MESRKKGTDSVATDDRRQFDRIPGPFDGRRVGALETPVRIYDLSEGGCFINSLHEQQPGVVFRLKIDVPFEGWIDLKAETLYRNPGFGFAVCFIEMNEETKMRLRRALQQLKTPDPDAA